MTLEVQIFWKISIKMNITTFYEAQTAFNEIIQPPTEQTLPMSLEQKFSYEVFLQTLPFQVLRECSSWESRNGSVQMLARKFVK